MAKFAVHLGTLDVATADYSPPGTKNCPRRESPMRLLSVVAIVRNLGV
jgi:hypothetical protein